MSLVYISCIIFRALVKLRSCTLIASSAKHLDKTHILASQTIKAYILSIVKILFSSDKMP